MLFAGVGSTANNTAPTLTSVNVVSCRTKIRRGLILVTAFTATFRRYHSAALLDDDMGGWRAAGYDVIENNTYLLFCVRQRKHLRVRE